MSYRLIDANDLSGKISEEDYKVVLDAPCIYADLPNGLDNEYHEIPKWIPVSERLPEDDDDVLVQMNDGSMMVDSRAASSNGWFWAELGDEPIAWMPLPEPYMEVEE